MNFANHHGILIAQPLITCCHLIVFGEDC